MFGLAPGDYAITIIPNATAATAGTAYFRVDAGLLLSSTKTSSAAEQPVNPGDLVTYTITLGNTGAVDANAAITDVLSAYYTVHDKMDFVEAPSGTLTWSGVITPTQSVSLHFVAQVLEPWRTLPVEFRFYNALRVDDGVRAPYDVPDMTPPWLEPQRAFLPVLVRGFEFVR